MGTDLLPGHVYTDGETINGPSLTEHVSEATIKPTFYSARSAKDPVVGTDEFLIRDTVADQYRKVALTTLLKLMVGAGSVIQTSYGEYTANSNLSAQIPADDTIPQNTEGTEILTASITPVFSSSRILVRFTGGVRATTLSGCVVALFRDAAVSALAGTLQTLSSSTDGQIISLEYLDSPSSTSALTYRIRTGPASAATHRWNGDTTTRILGGVFRTTLTLMEIKS